MELIPDPDFERTHVTRRVLREDQRGAARRRDAERMRDARGDWERAAGRASGQEAKFVKRR